MPVQAAPAAAPGNTRPGYVDDIVEDAASIAEKLRLKALSLVTELHQVLSAIEAGGEKDLVSAKEAAVHVGEELHALVETGSEKAAPAAT